MRSACVPAESPIRVACIQLEPRFCQLEANIADSVVRTDAAAAGGARLMVLPELSSSGYVFATRAEAFALAEAIPHGPASGAWLAAAKRHGCWIVAGLAERAGERLFNSAVLIGPDGHIGTFRKVHLWAAENLCFEPCDPGFPVYATAIGRIGMLICYGGWLPEAYRLCALQGAHTGCVPTNWVPIYADLNLSEARRNRNWTSTRSCGIGAPMPTTRCSGRA